MGFSKYNFCTLFDSNYLAKGLNLYYSLENTCPSFHLYIFAFNEKCRLYLESLNLKYATVISLTEFEDTELLKVKPTRSIAEYCWTSTSSTILFCLNNFNIDHCTYLDSDLYFVNSPEPLFEEIGTASIAFTRHNYHFFYNQNKSNGEYCVQFMFFRKDNQGIAALKWWRERCLEWCYNYLEDGKFGDQGYLYGMLEKFQNICIIKNQGAGMAPWNSLKYAELNQTKNMYKVKSSGDEFQLIFFHFHYLHYSIEGNTISANPGKVFFNPKILDYPYIPYLKEIFAREKEIIGEKFNTSDIIVRFTFTSFIKKLIVIAGVQVKRNYLFRKLFVETRMNKSSSNSMK